VYGGRYADERITIVSVATYSDYRRFETAGRVVPER
jgi:hypothetical protein